MKGEPFTPKKKEDTIGTIFKEGANFKPKDSANNPKRKLKLNSKFGKKFVESTTPQTSSFREAPPPLTLQEQKKLSKLKSRAEKAAKELYEVVGGARLQPPHCGSAKVEEKLPTRQELKLIQKAKGKKSKVQLHFEEEIKAPKDKLEVLEKPNALLKQGVSSVAKSAGSTVLDGGSQEQSLEETSTRKVVSKGVDMAGSGIKSVVSIPRKIGEHRYDSYEKAKEKAVTKTVNADYTKFRIESQNRYDSPSLLNKKSTGKPSSNPLSKALQKRRFAKDYRKALLEQSGKIGKSISQKMVGLANGITKHVKKIGLIAVAIFLCFTVIGSCMQGAGTVATETVKGIFATSYMADDAEIADSDWHFSQLEADFQSQIDMAETTYSGYDEFHYFLGGVETDVAALSSAMTHDPFQLISFLSVMYEDFNADAIQGEISSFFHTLYQLDFETITETRYRTAYDENGDPYQEAYTYKILNTKLVVNNWAETIQPFIDSKDGGRQYEEYINSGGNHQQFGTPFNFNWYGLITCHYGGRDNPTGANTGANLPNGKEMHTGLDIGVGIGTPIYSIMEGSVTFAGWHNLYGYYVDVTDSKGNKSRYAHCSVLQVAAGQQVKRGQILALSGDTGNVTGAHLHLEIFLGGTRLNPIFLVQYQPAGTTNESED